MRRLTGSGCWTGETCPDVIELDDGSYLVIGAFPFLTVEAWQRVYALGAGVGEGEVSVIVPGDVLREAARRIAGERSDSE
ncbi:hypothetical protein [Streptomyces sp. NPDC059009]|uniref:hypothetical protein n=1 Tax=Streptomyces sp. NPDC059009 TaxID=3346694 RepID=UPI0036BFCA18